VGALLDERRKETTKRFEGLKKQLANAERLCGDVACVYVTGSYGRNESSSHSDLDLFIVGAADAKGHRKFGNLNEIMVKADLIDATRKLKFPDFSGEGEYLEQHTVTDLVKKLGAPDDDVLNTFTARLLLLLESRPLLGRKAYQKSIATVVRAYWRDYRKHKTDFMPAFLANDILRMWRTFCVNYEARTQTEPAKKRAKRRLKNYKLKHSRLLTCYSALLYLAAIYAKNGTVSPADVMKMVSMTPTQRVEWMLGEARLKKAHKDLKRVLALYERFLVSTDAPERDIVKKLMHKATARKFLKSQHEFGDTVEKVLSSVGGHNKFHRLIVV
jgi:predicted nucleotidyltransferase